jgi:hypothetical protein
MKHGIFEKIRVNGGQIIVEIYIIVAAFAVIGGGLKYIDQAFDEEVFDKRVAITLAFVLIVLWIGLSFLDSASATILLAILAGVLITGKIDNSIFGVSSAAILTSFSYFQKVLLPPLIILSAAGVLDEIGNDYADSHNTKGVVRFFFLHRFSMKIALLGLSLAGFFALYYFLAFIFFDLAYDTIGFISNNSSEEISLEKQIGNENVAKNTA